MLMYLSLYSMQSLFIFLWFYQNCQVILKVDDDFKWLICKDIKSKKLPTEEEQQKIPKVKKIEEGRCLPEHQKKK